MPPVVVVRKNTTAVDSSNSNISKHTSDCRSTIRFVGCWFSPVSHRLGAQGTVGFVKFDIKDINSADCVDPGKGIKEVAQVASMGFREVLIAGGHVNKVEKQNIASLRVGLPNEPAPLALTMRIMCVRAGQKSRAGPWSLRT